MKKMKFNTVAVRTVATCFALGLFMAAPSAAACTLQNWSGVSGLTDADNAGGPTDGIPRYSGVCAMKAEGGVESWVQDDSPGGISRIRARFYLWAQGDAGVVYRGLNGSGGTVFEVEVSQPSGDVFLTSGSDAAACLECAVDAKWNSFEVDWNAGGNELSITVNEAQPNVQPLDSSETVSSVQLGNLSGVSGDLIFEAYESRRTTEIGRLLRGDANNDGAVTVFDAIAVVNEAAGTTENPNLASGQPDCNEDGAVTVFDAICVVNVASGN